MKNQIKTITKQWIGPIVILVLVMVVMVMDFSTKSQINANNTVARNIISTAEKCSRNINDDITLLEKVGKPIAEILLNIMEPETLNQDLSQEVKLLEIAVSNSSAYMAYICDEEGNAVNNDGDRTSIVDIDFYEELQEAEGTRYHYTYDDGEGRDAIIFSMPIVSKGKDKLYLLMFYSLSNMENMVENYEFRIWNIETLLDSNGTIIASYGNSAYWKQGDNLFEVLQSKSSTIVKEMKSHINGRISAVEPIDENNSMVCTPIVAGNWSVVFGVSQSYIDKQTEQQWILFKNMVYQLVAVFGVFVLFIISYNIVVRIYNGKKQKQLESKADTDLLTGLNNKLATERKIKEFIEQNPDAQSMMFIFDIDNFKKINDTMGHAFGDEVLRSLGQQIRVIFRSSDIIGRAGGDEFIVFLKNITEDEAIRKEAKKVEDFFKDFKAGEYTKYSATASIGVAIFPHEGADFESLYKAADSALYKAKQRGKKQLAFYNDKWLG